METDEISEVLDEASRKTHTTVKRRRLIVKWLERMRCSMLVT